MGHGKREPEPEDTQDVVDDEDLEGLDPLDARAVGNAWWKGISWSLSGAGAVLVAVRWV